MTIDSELFLTKFNDDDDDDFNGKLAALGILPKRKTGRLVRLRTLIVRAVTAPFRGGRFLLRMARWHLWGKRRFLRGIDNQTGRWRQLAGIKEQKPQAVRPYTEMERLANLRSNLEYPGGNPHTAHEEALQKIVLPRPPKVTDRIAVDYHVILGDPYLVSDVDGRKVAAPRVPRKKRAPAKPAKRTRTHGKPRR